MFVTHWGLQVFKVRHGREDKIEDYHHAVFSWYRKRGLPWKGSPKSPVGWRYKSVALLHSIECDGFKVGAAE